MCLDLFFTSAGAALYMPSDIFLVHASNAHSYQTFHWSLNAYSSAHANVNVKRRLIRKRHAFVTVYPAIYCHKLDVIT